MRFSLKKYVRTIAANSQTDVDVFGDKVFARSVPSGCQIKFDDGEPVDFYTGIRFGVNSWVFDVFGSFFPSVAAKLSPNGFKKISIVNNNSSAVAVEVVAGFGDISDDSLNGFVTSRERLDVVGMVETSKTAKEFASIYGSTASNVKELIVSNTGAVEVEVRRANIKICSIYPDEVIRLPRSGTPYFFGSSAAAWKIVTVIVGYIE